MPIIVDTTITSMMAKALSRIWMLAAPIARNAFAFEVLVASPTRTNAYSMNMTAACAPC